MLLKSRGKLPIRSGRFLLASDYCPGDVGPGSLSLTLENQSDYDSVDVQLRLDPWIADEYSLFEYDYLNCLIICGHPAVVAIDSSKLTLLSSVGLEYEEGETIDAPYQVLVPEHKIVVLATERRVWCLDADGHIRWMWTCRSTAQERWIRENPTVDGDRVCIPVGMLNKEIVVDLLVSDGLPILSRR